MDKRIEASHEDPVIEAYMFFIQAAREATKHADSRFFRALKLSMVKYLVLKALKINGGVLTHSDLAIWTDTKRHNITTLVRRMKAEGLVNTERDEKDRRLTQVRLTEKGRDIFVKANPVAYDLINEVMSGIGKRQVAQLCRILRIMKDNIQKAS
jgi:DNA-binding MarR family transcriptional regulator